MATVSSAPAPGMQQIDLSKLSVQQLAQLKQQLDQEIGVIQDSLQTLKIAQAKFHESEQSLERITPDTKGETILVPLTGSMYIPGTIADIKNVLIDIGTGYYAQKDIEDGKDYFKRKVKFVTPLDFFYWGCLKDIVYKEPISTIDQLRERINRAVEIINQAGHARRVKRSFIRRCRACIRAHGGHFEHLL